MKKLKTKGFSTIEVLLVLILLAILGFTGYYVYHAQHSANATLDDANKAATSFIIPKKGAVTTFAECKKAAGSNILTTYPEQCMTKDGQKFTDPSAKPLPPQPSN